VLAEPSRDNADSRGVPEGRAASNDMDATAPITVVGRGREADGGATAVLRAQAAGGDAEADEATRNLGDTRRLTVPPSATPWPRWARVLVSFVVLAVVAALAGAVYRATWLATHVATPSLVGRNVGDAGRIVLPLQLGVTVTEQRQDPHAAVGVILAQDPPPGLEVSKGSVIGLTISQGSGIVPDLHGLGVLRAAHRLETAGLRLGRVSYTYSDLVPSGAVIAQFVSPGKHLAPNGPVDVLVSEGRLPFPLNVPWFLPGSGPGGPGLDQDVSNGSHGGK
jgi:hypothetical protein